MAALLLLVFSVKYIGVGLWIFLLGLATYVFCFFKFQQIVFLMLPDPSTDSTLYTSFQTLYFVQLALVILAVIILLINIGVNVDYFLIDWEK